MDRTKEEPKGTLASGREARFPSEPSSRSVHDVSSLELHSSVAEDKKTEEDRRNLIRAVQGLRWDNKELRGRLKKIIKDVEGRFKSMSLDGTSITIAQDDTAAVPDSYFYENLVSKLHNRCDEYRKVLESEITSSLDLLCDKATEVPGLTFNTISELRKVLLDLGARVTEQQDQEKALVRTTRALHNTAVKLSKNESSKITRKPCSDTALTIKDSWNDQMKHELSDKAQQLLHTRSKLQDLERLLRSMRESGKIISANEMLLEREMSTSRESTLPSMGRESSRTGSDLAARNKHLVKQVKLLTRRLHEQSRKLRFSEKQRKLFNARMKAAKAVREGSLETTTNDTGGISVKRNNYCFDTYTPLCVQNAPEFVIDFLTYIVATHGYFPNVFLEEAILNDEDRITCIDVLCREFSLFYQRSNALRDLLEHIDEISRIRDSSEALAAISSLCVKYINCDRVAIWVIDERRQTAWTKHTGNAPHSSDNTEEGDTSKPTALRIPLSGGLVGAAYTSRSPINIVDAYNDPRFNSSVDKATGYRTRSVLCMPIMRGPKCLAVLQVINKLSPSHSLITGVGSASSGAPAKFDGHDEFLLQIIGGVTVQVLEHCLADEVGRMKGIRKDILLEAGFKILSHQSCKTLRDLVQQLSLCMGQLFHAGRCSLAICEFDAIQVVNMKKPLSATTPTDPSSFCTIITSKTRGLVGEAIQSRGYVITQNAVSSPKYDVDVDVQVEGSGSETVYSWPSVRLGRVTLVSIGRLVFQWTSSAISSDNLKMGDESITEGDGTFKALQQTFVDRVGTGKGQVDNPSHMEIMDKVLKMIEERVENWWPASDRMKPKTVNLHAIKFTGKLKKALTKHTS
ncbi:hypothetical protein FOL47_001436 [Perkinsus chesapeaki]|uniref:GAF domain-containing protein n=1 Tax=Perkinsus chesapeaki TaxID=330153 RepID=A0A7J6MJF3_PERCH|nr:hypothetical protein FOL47_001436 [Perkinsus chesapeaki]